MTSQEQIRTLIYRAIDRVNETLKPADAVAKSPDTVLMGDAQVFDSMGFVTFMAALEDLLSRTTGRELSVVDTMFAEGVDEWTADTLAVHVAEMLAGRSSASDGVSDAATVVGFPRAVRMTAS